MPFTWITGPQLPAPPEPEPIPSTAISYKVDLVANTVNAGGFLVYNTSSEQYDVRYPDNDIVVGSFYANTYSTLNASFMNVTLLSITERLNANTANIPTLNVGSITANSVNINVFYSPLIVEGTVSADPTTPLGIASKQYVDNTNPIIPHTTGQVSLFAGGIPNGWISVYSTADRNTHSGLFSNIGTRYGEGNGTNTFGLPIVYAPIDYMIMDHDLQNMLATQNDNLVRIQDGRLIQIGGRLRTGTSNIVADNTTIGVMVANSIIWHESTPFPFAAQSAAAIVLSDNRILVCGGVRANGTVETSVQFGNVTGNSIVWSTGTHLPAGRAKHKLTQLSDGTIIVVGGHLTLTDTGSNTILKGVISGTTITWSSYTNLPIAVGRSGHCVIETGNNQIFVGVGSDALGNSYIGNISGLTITWTDSNRPPSYTMRDYSANKLPDGRILIHGGIRSDTPTISTHSWLVTLNGTSTIWTQAQTPPVYDTIAAANTSSVFLNDGTNRVLSYSAQVTANLVKPYVFMGSVRGNNISWFPRRIGYQTLTLAANNILVQVGGWSGTDTRDNVYFGAVQNNINHIDWNDENNCVLPGRRFTHATTLLNDGRLLVAGGLNEASALRPNTYFGTINPSGNNITWVEGTALPAPKYGLKINTLQDGRVIVTGGVIATGQVREVLLGNVSGNTITWANTANNFLPSPLYFHESSILPDGRVFVTGGLDAASLDTVFFGRVIGSNVTWTAGTPMPTPRHSHSVSILNDGRALISGGVSSQQTGLGFDVITGTFPPNGSRIRWKFEKPLPQLKYFHDSATIPNNRVIIQGGLDDESLTSMTGSSEVYVVLPMVGIKL